MLGPGNEAAAQEALQAWPGGLQVGGGITAHNAARWVDECGADKVIVTSYLFPGGRFDRRRLGELVHALGGRTDRLVVDLSCRREAGSDGGVGWFVAVDKWQTVTDFEISESKFDIPIHTGIAA